MISIENRLQFAKAEAKAREVKPRVWALPSFGSYMVEGHDKDYKVTLSRDSAGHWQAECNCAAHSKGTPRPCYHLPSAWACHRIQVGIKQQLRAAF